uniref:Uncharacterized protein n=2 Tax=Parascaris univalens TaxID=6257 RepID=A0A914ZZT9_PARUN
MRLVATIVLGVISTVASGYYCDNTKNIVKGAHSNRIYCLDVSESLGHPRELYNLRYCKYFSEKAILASVHAVSIGHIIARLYRETSNAKRYPVSRMLFWFGLKTINGTLLFDDGTETATFVDLLSRLNAENFGGIPDDDEKCWLMSMNANGHNITFRTMKCEPNEESLRAKRIHTSALCQYEKPEESGNHLLKKREVGGNNGTNVNKSATLELPPDTFSAVPHRDDIVVNTAHSNYNSTITQAVGDETFPPTFGNLTYFADVNSSIMVSETKSFDVMMADLNRTESLPDNGFLVGATTLYSRDATTAGSRSSETKRDFTNTHSTVTPIARPVPKVTDILSDDTGIPSSMQNQRSTAAFTSRLLPSTPSTSHVTTLESSEIDASTTATVKETATVAAKQSDTSSAGTTASSTIRLSTSTGVSISSVVPTTVTTTIPALMANSTTTTLAATESAESIRSTEIWAAHGTTSLRMSTVGAARSSDVSDVDFTSTAPISGKRFNQEAERVTTQSSTTSQNNITKVTSATSHNTAASYTSGRIQLMTSTPIITAYWRKSNDTKLSRKASEQSLADKILLYTSSSLCGAGMIASASCFLLSCCGLILADTRSKPTNE